MKKLGLIVNPVAGLGGAVGLKGTDGEEILRRAIELGAEPKAEIRATEALLRLTAHRHAFTLLTCSETMGATVAQRCGLDYSLVEASTPSQTSAQDTVKAAREMVSTGVELLLFAGGDGTARDVCSAVSLDVPVLGIPAGVKIHSAVYASSPAAAGEIAASFVKGTIRRFIEAEVLDIDEDEYRREILAARLYGTLTVPDAQRYLQGLKAGSGADDRLMQEAAAADVVESLDAGWLYLIGPGTTCRPIMEQLGLDNSLLGFDLVSNGRQLGKDMTEREILEAIDDRPIKLILTPVGGQGFLLGRGNQQISPRVIDRIGKDNIIILATDAKLCSLHGGALLVDSGDEETDRLLAGHYRVITGYHKSSIYRVASPV